MNYREGTIEDWPQVKQLILGSKYFSPITVDDLGGHWIVAEMNDRIYGVIWAFAERPHAYIDYLYVAPEYRKTKVPGRLILAMELALRDAGIKYVRCNVLMENVEAMRLVHALGVGLHLGYALGYKEL